MKIKTRLHNAIQENKRVGENYMFMTALQIINMCFYLLIYPLLIRRMGAESYGLYAFAWSVVTIAAAVVGFGFDLVGAKHIAEGEGVAGGRLQVAGGRWQVASEVVSAITYAKLGLLLLVGAVYWALMLLLPQMGSERLLFGIAFAQAGVNILFPQWYFQGVQRMKVVTYIQLAVKIATLPLIIWLIHDSNDAWLLMLITVSGGWMGGLAAWIILRWKEGVRLVGVKWHTVKTYYTEAFPLFLTNIMSIVKEQGVVMLVGGCLGMREVAIYDLANKIVTVPRIMLLQINNALFPKIVVERNAERIRKIMRMEAILSASVILLIAAVGKWCALLLGGAEMVGSWPVSILLSGTILCWMIGTAYIDFVFIPSGNNTLVAWNQLVALISFAIAGGIGITLAPSVYTVVAALVLSGLSEVLYCCYITQRKHLLQK